MARKDGATALLNLVSFVEHLGGTAESLKGWTSVPVCGKYGFISPDDGLVYRTKASVLAALQATATVAKSQSSVKHRGTTYAEAVCADPATTSTVAATALTVASVTSASASAYTNDDDDDDDDDDGPFMFLRTRGIASQLIDLLRPVEPSSLFEDYSTVTSANSSIEPPSDDYQQENHDDDIRIDLDCESAQDEHRAAALATLPTQPPSSSEASTSRTKKSKVKRPVYTREREALKQSDWIASPDPLKIGIPVQAKAPSTDGIRSSSVTSKAKKKPKGDTKTKRLRGGTVGAGRKRQKQHGGDVESTINLLNWLQECVLPALAFLISLELEADKAPGASDGKDAFAAINRLIGIVVKIPIGISGKNPGVDETLQSMCVAAQKRNRQSLQDAASSLAEYCVAATVAIQL